MQHATELCATHLSHVILSHISAFDCSQRNPNHTLDSLFSIAKKESVRKGNDDRVKILTSMISSWVDASNIR